MSENIEMDCRIGEPLSKDVDAVGDLLWGDEIHDAIDGWKVVIFWDGGVNLFKKSQNSPGSLRNLRKCGVLATAQNLRIRIFQIRFSISTPVG